MGRVCSAPPGAVVNGMEAGVSGGWRREAGAASTTPEVFAVIKPGKCQQRS